MIELSAPKSVSILITTAIFSLISKFYWILHNTDLFNPLVPKAHNSESQNLPIPLQNNPVRVS